MKSRQIVLYLHLRVRFFLKDWLIVIKPVNISIVFVKIELKKVHECHQRTSILSLECNIGYRIRVLEAFYGVSVDPRRDYCHEGYKEKDCKSQTSFQNTCNGRSSCSLHFFKVTNITNQQM